MRLSRSRLLASAERPSTRSWSLLRQRCDLDGGPKVAPLSRPCSCERRGSGPGFTLRLVLYKNRSATRMPWCDRASGRQHEKERRVRKSNASNEGHRSESSHREKKRGGHTSSHAPDSDDSRGGQSCARNVQGVVKAQRQKNIHCIHCTRLSARVCLGWGVGAKKIEDKHDKHRCRRTRGAPLIVSKQADKPTLPGCWFKKKRQHDGPRLVDNSDLPTLPSRPVGTGEKKGCNGTRYVCRTRATGLTVQLGVRPVRWVECQHRDPLVALVLVLGHQVPLALRRLDDE